MAGAPAGSGGVLVIAPDWDQQDWAAKLARHDPHRPIHTWRADAPPAEYSYAAVWNPPTGALAAISGLRVIFNLGAGVDHLLDDATLPPVPIVRCVNANLTGRMTEYVVCQVLLHHRRIPAYRTLQEARTWKALPQPAANTVNVGIMGLGVLGEAAAQALVSLGFGVAGWSRSEKSIAGITCHAGASGLEAFLAGTDILVCLLPATPQTAGILNADLFARLRHDGALGGPVLINAGRGTLQVEDDIIKALDDGMLAGASLDVFDPEPLATGSPLWDHPQVIITPHIAADSDPQAICTDVMAQIAAFEAAGIAALPNRVDPGQGY